MKSIYFWSPFNSKIGTINSVINSIKSINQYSNNYFKPVLLDSTFEWSNFENLCEIKYLRKGKQDFRKKQNKGFVYSRIFYLKIFLSCFFPLKKVINSDKPDFLIVHLITSLPILLFIIFNFDTKLILRISGEPKLNLFRKLLWKLINKKIFMITCPSTDTKKQLSKLNIFHPNKIKILFDPVLDIKKIKEKKNIELDQNLNGNEYFLSVGRLTRQKNFLFLINCFEKFLLKNPNYKLIILGDGEQYSLLKKVIEVKNLHNKIILKGFEQNVYKYMIKAKCFVLPSLYENPGHVLIEAAFCNCPIISSNCPTGPEEFLKKGEAGYLFEVNNQESLLSKLQKFLIEENKSIKKKKYLAKLNCREFTKFKHYKNLLRLLSQ